MLVKQLLESANQEAIVHNILDKYPEEELRIKSGYYHNLISSMKKSVVVENEEQRTIHVEYSKDFGVTNKDFIWNASYSTHKRYNHKYALKFATVEDILSSFVMERDLHEQSVERYFAILLFEMAHGDIVEETEGEFYCV